MNRITNSTGVEHKATSADFTVADVLAWARTKPADERYNYVDSSNCALCHFLRETGRSASPSVNDVTWSDGLFGARILLPEQVNEAVQGADYYDICQENRWSFGALVTRLEALCPETPVTQSNWSAIDAYLSDIEQVETVPA